MSKPIRKRSVARNVEDKAELRGAILKAARQIVIAKGFGELSIRKLAAEIGYAPGTIYLYFKSRDEIVREICVQGFAELGTAMMAAGEKETEPIAKFTALLKSYVDFAVKNPETYRLSFMENPQFADEMFRLAPLETEHGAGRKALNSLAIALKELKEIGEISETEDETLLAEIFWTAIHGAVSLKLIYPAIPFNSVEKLIDKTIQTLFRGLKNDSLR